jgi:hypothetical protein
MDMIIKETTVWGQSHNVRNVNKRIRLMKKQKINYFFGWISIYRPSYNM